MNGLGQYDLIKIAAFALWSTWVTSWLVAARWSAPTAKRPASGKQLPDRLLVASGSLCLLLPPVHQNLGRLYSLHVGASWGLVGLIALGLAFTWWARLHLGRMWSGTVTRKEDHRIIDTGPYAIVRHPIYTGLLLALAATAGLKATLLGFAGIALIVIGFYLKARLEESFLSEDLGPDYAAYKKRVPMLIPFFGV